jgi:hypothetical protein
MQLLEAVGFTASNEALCLTADTHLAPLHAALARLRRVADDKGHSGEAEFFSRPTSSNSSQCGTAGGVSPLLVGDIEACMSTCEGTHQCYRRWQDDHAVATPTTYIQSSDWLCAAAAHGQLN